MEPTSAYDPIKLEIFKHLFAAVAEEMGAVLRKASYSPNIKERRDYSCALFDSAGDMVAQAAHIPVHLGSMPLSVASAIHHFSSTEGLKPGDAILLNDPYLGGTHLPDITLVNPVFLDTDGKQPVLIGFVASRAHHADVGGMTAGSMPVAREIYQEGLIIPPVKLYREGVLNQAVLDLILANVRTPQERLGDLRAQIAANQRGGRRLVELFERYGDHETKQAMQALLAYTERVTRNLLNSLPDGEYSFEDFLDDDGITSDPIPIRVRLSITGDRALVDFSQSAAQQQGSINVVRAITLSAVYYVFRSLLGIDVPNNTGCLAPIEVITPPGSIVNAQHPAPVAGGNVETSQRIVDVLLGALSQACPDRIPAASQGTMNNVTIGGFDHRQGRALSPTPFTYYETIGGGTGGGPGLNGQSGVHSHMTNTLNTPVEALEYAYPLRVRRYSLYHGSGGSGVFPGGEGIVREIELLSDAQVTLLSERRRFGPYGLQGGSPGRPGINLLKRSGIEQPLPGKISIELKTGDVICIKTPGGGGWGKAPGDHSEDKST
jgi:N-methylhydantoinase B